MPDKNAEDLYRSQAHLNSALMRIGKEKDLLPEHKRLVKRLDQHLESKGLSAKRRKKYANTMPVLLRQLKKPLERATQADLERLVTWIERGGLGGWSEATKEDYKQVLKFAWKFSKGYDPEDKPKEVRFIKVRKVITPPEWLPSDELVTKAIGCAMNPRDKFIIAALREGGFRTAELAYMALADWKVDGALIEVRVPTQGKTGQRTLFLHDAMPYYKQWLAVHPRGADPSAPLIVNLEGRRFGERMSPFAALKVVHTAFKRAGSPRPVSIQLLRKRCCTEMAGKLNAQDLNDRQGWTQGSTMARHYVKFSKEHQKDLARRLHGIEAADKPKERSVRCVNPLCQEVNPVEQRFCFRCHSALNVDAALEVKKLKDMINADQAEFYKTGDLSRVLARIQARLDALEEVSK